MKSLVEQKKILREKFLKKRLAVPKKEVREKSLLIAKKVLSLDKLLKADRICAYLPVNHEVETKSIIDSLVFQGKQVFLPKHYDPDYKLVKFENWNELEAGPYGILEPKGSVTASPQSMDVAIIPGVAFDKHGVRLGYGKGVFDQLFSKSSAFKIGLAYDSQIVDDLPKEEHDLVMDLVAT